MYKGLLVVATVAAAFIYYKTHAPLVNPVAQAEPQQIEVSAVAATAEPAFRCEGKQHCSQMASCAEARFYLKNCPATLLMKTRAGQRSHQGWAHARQRLNRCSVTRVPHCVPSDSSTN